ncbi:polysaccharide pyruvyl transferase family protein [Christiangramia sp. SM2212]|uniref:Polysaccharide pyruvyl transferase family protein n=1 Tax=Christiangramia sediminicola TaxID=3073267 RepID=A0ABU1EMS0_9FLAO|nr:polysaccharide pyruvyl transferase family protein [Christiangramia sp. SM2212]MDR5589683.1 polysaccharide pyruvyl transferase family protein [Christiangramia sp. SM2212]
MDKKRIPLFYWSEIKFIYREKENYGDLLSKYIVEQISGRKVKFVQPKKQPWYRNDKKSLLAIGSIIHHADRNSIVWGSGIIDHKQPVAKAKFEAVRGPRTRKHLLSLGYQCPEVYGDPAILLPKYYMPEIEKKYEIGIIPHYHDYAMAMELFKDIPEILVIDLLTLDIEEVTNKILTCKKTLSSSLHGLIVSHAYQIPSLWVEFSDKIFGNGVKYLDYLESIDLPLYKPEKIFRKLQVEEMQFLFENNSCLPEIEKMRILQDNLIRVWPFK